MHSRCAASWTGYEKILAADGGMGRRDLILAQHSFYSGARGVLKVVGCMIEQGSQHHPLQWL
jgi:hypothetical protein